MDPFPPEAEARDILEKVRAKLRRVSLTLPASGLVELEGEIAALSDAELLGAPVGDRDMAACVRSGLLLRADLMDASHRKSQSIDTPTGSYWHGILHRREPDFSNARYWFRRVGAHPAFGMVARAVLTLGNPAEEVLRDASWDPFRFIDLCESCVTGARSDLRSVLEAVQEIESNVLLEYSYRQAVGDTA